MYRLVHMSLLWVLCVVLHASPALGQKIDPRDVIERAVKTIGGKKKALARKQMTWSAEGTYHGGASPLEYEATYAVAWPDKLRMEVSGVFVIVLNGDKGWVQAGGNTREMNLQQLKQQQESHYAGWVATLLPLLENENKFSLKRVGKQQVDDRPAIGLRVSHDDHKDVTLFFDEESGLLVKSETKAEAPELSFQEVKVEVFHKDYKEVDGLNVPHAILVHRDGEVYVKGKSSQIRFVEKHDEGVFDRP